MVILAVMAMLIILTILATQLSDASLALQLQQKAAVAREGHYQMARSGVELAMQLINADDPSVDSAQDLWALGSQSVRWEGKKMILEIRDEDSRFPINMITNVTTTATTGAPAASATTTTNTTTTTGNTTSTVTLYQQALTRLLTRGGLPGAEAMATLEDWTDADDVVSPGGAEQGSYPNIRVKNGPLDSLDELQNILRWGPCLLPPPPPLSSGQLTAEEQTAVQNTGASSTNTTTSSGGSWAGVPGGSEWSDWLTLWSGGKININTAPNEVLRCLDPAMTDTIVQELTSSRAQKVLKSQQDIQSVAGIDADLAYRLTKLVGFKSQYFRVRVVVDESPGRVSLEAVVARGTNHTSSVVFWRVN
jgi:type II secretory pathway component PulK